MKYVEHNREMSLSRKICGKTRLHSAKNDRRDMELRCLTSLIISSPKGFTTPQTSVTEEVHGLDFRFIKDFPCFHHDNAVKKCKYVDMDPNLYMYGPFIGPLIGHVRINLSTFLILVFFWIQAFPTQKNIAQQYCTNNFSDVYGVMRLILLKAR